MRGVARLARGPLFQALISKAQSKDVTRLSTDNSSNSNATVYLIDEISLTGGVGTCDPVVLY